jgi:hypothetical protein
MQIPHHPWERLWMAEHTGPRHRVTLAPHTHTPIAEREGIEYAQYIVRCSCDPDDRAVTVTCLEAPVYERYAQARDSGLTVPTLTPKTNMRWDLDPYTTARRLNARRARRIPIDDHPWPAHAPAVQVFEKCFLGTTVKVEILCSCGFHDGLTFETPDGRLSFDDFPRPAAKTITPAPTAPVEPAPIVELAPEPQVIISAPSIPAKPLRPDLTRLDISRVRAVMAIPTEALRRARLALTGTAAGQH